MYATWFGYDRSMQCDLGCIICRLTSLPNKDFLIRCFSTSQPQRTADFAFHHTIISHILPQIYVTSFSRLTSTFNHHPTSCKICFKILTLLPGCDAFDFLSQLAEILLETQHSCTLNQPRSCFQRKKKIQTHLL